MKTSTMCVLYDLDEQIERIVKQKHKQYSCIITLYIDTETRSTWMGVITLDGRCWNDIMISNRDNKDAICVGIMRWFKENGNDVNSSNKNSQQ